MKKIALTYALISSFFLLQGCSGNVNSSNEASNTQQESSKTSESELQTETPVMKEVVFINAPESWAWNGIKPEKVLERMEHECKYNYEYDEAKDKDTLYAFAVQFMYLKNDAVKPTDYPMQEDSETNVEFEVREQEYLNVKLVETMKNAGVWIIEERSAQDTEFCVIACTMNDLVRMFDGKDGIYGTWEYIITPVTRPDWLDVLEEAGYPKDSGIDTEYWYGKNYEAVDEIVEMQPQVTMSVEVK